MGVLLSRDLWNCFAWKHLRSFVLQGIVLSCSRPVRSALQYEYRYASSAHTTPTHQSKVQKVVPFKPVYDSVQSDKPWLLLYSVIQVWNHSCANVEESIEHFPVSTQQEILSWCNKNQAAYMHVFLFCFFCLLVFTFLAECIAVCFCFCVCACACMLLLLLLLLHRWQPALAVVSQIAEESLAKAWPCLSYSLPWRESRAPQIWAQVLTLTDTFPVNRIWEEYEEKCSAAVWTPCGCLVTLRCCLDAWMKMCLFSFL